MIVSHKHKFIFVKTKKTAGTSVEIALSSICGPDDIITPITPADEEYRAELNYRSAQNYVIPFSRYNLKDFGRMILQKKRLIFYNHMPAVQIKRYIGADIWNSYFKFTIERNPYDKFVSLYYWKGGDEQFGNMTKFIESGVAISGDGKQYYNIDGKLAVDSVYRFESLDAAMADISQKLNLETPLELPKKKTKGHTRVNKVHYSEKLNQTEREWIEKNFSKEIEMFDYQFEQK
ncbi:MAG: sulfotransferase family 2 domain-containing protein [Flavobacteriia bacterium]|nr:sulfotransferase family 2 domain-containing protein [Flavobacteriia bacterium]